MVSNPNFYGQSTHGTPNQIEDGVDFPHTGIIKALSDGLGQNYAISGFDITIDSATQIDVSEGVIFRDGERLTVAAVPNLTLSSTYTNGYHLLVANNHTTAPVLEIRSPSGVTAAANKVAEYNTGDTIIAVITHNGTANVGIQYLTVNKTQNSLSVGHNDGGYTETGTIIGASGGTTLTSTGTLTLDADDTKITASGNGKPTLTLENTAGIASAGNEPEIIFDRTGASDATTSGDLGRILWKGKDDGGNTHTYLGIHGEALDETGGTEDGRIRFTVAKAGGDGVSANQEYLRMAGGEGVVFNHNKEDINFAIMGDTTDNVLFADAGTEKVGMGTGSPDEKLHVVGNVKITNDLTLGGGDIAMGNGQDSTIKVDATTSSTAGRDLTLEAGSTATNGSDINGGDLILKAGGGDGTGTSIMTFSTKVANTDTVAERMRISTTGKVGIGTTAPTQTLGVNGSIGAASFVISVVEVTGKPLPTAGLVANPNSGAPCLELNSETHRTIIADTQTFVPPNPPSLPNGDDGQLSLLLPAASGTHIGWEMRIICTNNAGAPQSNLTLDVTNSTDLIVNAQMATLGNSTTGMTLLTGKIYTVIHISPTQYMAIQLN